MTEPDDPAAFAAPNFTAAFAGPDFTAAFAGPQFAAAFASRGWAVAPGFLDAAAVTALREVSAARLAAGEFRPGRVGRGDAVLTAPALRSDRIRWLAADDPDAAVRAALARLDALRLALNRTLYLGLDRLEAHFAAYAPGARYGLHVDRFRDDDARVVSVVLYLNDGWSETDGGALRLYLPVPGPGQSLSLPALAPASNHDIPPAGGTLVAFLSDRFAHEVLPARRDRWSLTGWFRRRTAGLDIE